MRQRKTETVTFTVIENTLLDEVRTASTKMFLKHREAEALRRDIDAVLFETHGVHNWMTTHASAYHRRALKRLWRKGYIIRTTWEK